MATLEKLVRTVEALKLTQNPSSVSLDETMSKKDKMSHCVSVTDLVCSQGGKNSPEAAKCLVMAIEMFFTLLDDQDADIRMVADENLNRMTRSLGESNIGRLQVSLKCLHGVPKKMSYFAWVKGFWNEYTLKYFSEDQRR